IRVVADAPVIGVEPRLGTIAADDLGPGRAVRVVEGAVVLGAAEELPLGIARVHGQRLELDRVEALVERIEVPRNPAQEPLAVLEISRLQRLWARTVVVAP